jgi:P4 family phage/plasmid primase-like protien
VHDLIDPPDVLAECETDPQIDKSKQIDPPINLRCHAPILASEASLYASAMTEEISEKYFQLNTVRVANWFGETFLDGGLLCATAGTSDDGTFFLWKGTHWEAIHNAHVEHDIDQIFQKPRLTNEIVKMIRRNVLVSRSALDANAHRLFLRNTVLEFVRTLSGIEIVQCAHSRTDQNTYFIDVDYDPNQTAYPRWSAFLERALPDKDSRDLVQEVFGYCLLRGLEFQCFLVLCGPAATGKSTMLEVLNYVIGGRPDSNGKIISKFVTSKSLETLGERFGTAGLELSLVNISSESTFLPPAAESVLKRLTGGDPITVEYKNKDAFTCSCSPKIIVATNEIPKFGDRSEALNQRVIIMPFNQQIDLAEAEPDLARSIFKKEGQAILNWAIAGLLRLMEKPTGIRRERFTRLVASVEAAEEHRRDSNPVIAWMDEFVVMEPGGAVTKKDAYLDFEDFCRQRRSPPTLPHRQHNNFVKAVNNELRRLGHNPGKDDRRRHHGVQERVFLGMKLVPKSVHAKGNIQPPATTSPPVKLDGDAAA